MIVGDRVFDGERLLLGSHRVVIEGGTIARLEALPAGSAPRPGELDGRGGTILPGLINAHVHIARGGMFEPTEPLSLAQVARNLADTLAAGVTTVGDMGCPAPMIDALRRHTGSNPAGGPTIRASGPLVTAPRGYPLDWVPPLIRRFGVALPAGDARAAAAQVGRIAAAGMDHVKLAIMHEGYGGEPLPAVSAAVARAVVVEAHRLGLRVFAHAHSERDYDVALAAGVDALMHSCFEPLDRDRVSRVRDAGAFLCPTLWVFESVCLGAELGWGEEPRYAGVAPRIRASWRRFAEAYAASGDVLPPGIAGGRAKARAADGVRVAAANLLLCRDAGVPLGFGNDAAYGYSIHGCPSDELGAMARAGLPPLEILRAATAGAADLLGLADRGRLAAGQRADVLVVEGDALAEVGALAAVRAVVRGGERVGPARPSLVGTAHALAATARGFARTAASALRRDARELAP